MATFQELILISRPKPDQTVFEASNFELRESPIPNLKEGEFLVKITHFSCDPTMIIWAQDIQQYMPPVKVGERMRCAAIGQVEKSNHPQYAEGDLVSGLFGWTTHAVATSQTMFLSKLPANTPAEIALSVGGITGLTAYLCLLEVGKPKPGDTVFVTAAAGSTGSFVVQLAKLMGCRVIGTAGGAEKCKRVIEEYGADDCIDYRSEDVYERLKEFSKLEEFKGGIDVFYENVGGPVLDAGLKCLAMNARVALCGAISQYGNLQDDNVYGPKSYLNLLMRRGTMQGFIVTDYAAKIPEAAERMIGWTMAGKIKATTDVQEGNLASVWETCNRLFTSQNQGKQIHKLTT